MSIMTQIANGIGTLIGVLSSTAAQVVFEIRSSYNAYMEKFSAAPSEQEREESRTKEELLGVNDEIMHLRKKHMSQGGYDDNDRRRWSYLGDRREELLAKLRGSKEIRAARTVLDNEGSLEAVDIKNETSHIFQYNAFADVLGKVCPQCARPMKIQWRRELTTVGLQDFYWGCTGWYITLRNGPLCSYTERVSSQDFALLTDVSPLELQMSSSEFGDIISHPTTTKIIGTRLEDLRSDLNSQRHGVQMVACPLHGENMILRQKNNPSGLLDQFFLACPRWLPHNQGCAFIEKLKSGSQLAALLKSETGQGIL